MSGSGSKSGLGSEVENSRNKTVVRIMAKIKYRAIKDGATLAIL